MYVLFDLENAALPNHHEKMLLRKVEREFSDFIHEDCPGYFIEFVTICCDGHEITPLIALCRVLLLAIQNNTEYNNISQTDVFRTVLFCYYSLTLHEPTEYTIRLDAFTPKTLQVKAPVRGNYFRTVDINLPTLPSDNADNIYRLFHAITSGEIKLQMKYNEDQMIDTDISTYIRRYMLGLNLPPIDLYLTGDELTAPIKKSRKISNSNESAELDLPLTNLYLRDIKPGPGKKSRKRSRRGGKRITIKNT
jgi:hypothetical protein